MKLHYLNTSQNNLHKPPSIKSEEGQHGGKYWNSSAAFSNAFQLFTRNSISCQSFSTEGEITDFLILSVFTSF